MTAAMLPEDENEKRDAEAPPAPASGEPTGPHYGSLIEYPKDAPLPGATAAEPLVLEDETASIDQKLAATSTEPGIYLLRDRAGKVLYVGKAKSLRARVRSYFRDGGDGRFQVRFLMRRVRDFDTIVTASEKEALILENNLIKQYKPKYNIRLKDDKSYLSAKITNHAWPRITVTRKIVKDGGHYFGPFGSADGLRETIDVIRKVFPLRTCTDAVFRNRSRPCLEYQIKRCLGPCCLPVDRDEYGRHLHAAQMLLEGKNLELLREMRERMKDHASRLEFEQAARIRDRVRAIEKTVERQTVLHHWGIDEDVFGIYREGGYIEAIVLIVRSGKLTSTQGWSFQDLEFPVHEILSDLLTQYYSGPRNIPDEVIVPVELEDATVRAELLSERRGKKCEVFQPQRGEKLRLLEMAMDNARQSFASRRDNEKTREKMLEDLRVKLGLRNSPKRMECYDISNLQGSMVVGSQVTFDEGEPQKNLYRRYRIRSFEGQDDFASMYEVLKRRVERAGSRERVPGPMGHRRRQGSAQRRARSAARISAARSNRLRVLGQAARAERPARERSDEVRGARLRSAAQGSDRAAEKFNGAVPAREDSRRGASIRDHLQPRAAAAREAALGARRHRGHRPGAPARAAAPFWQSQADSRSDG